jgi:hypothetical protein
MGLSLSVCDRATQSKEDTTPLKEKHNKCQAIMLNEFGRKQSKGIWKITCISYCQTKEIHKNKWGEERPKWKVLRRFTFNTQAQVAKGRRKSKKENQRTRKITRRKSLKSLIMPLMTRHVTPLQKTKHHIWKRGTSWWPHSGHQEKKWAQLDNWLEQPPQKRKKRNKGQTRLGGEGKERTETLRITRQTRWLNDYGKRTHEEKK